MDGVSADVLIPQRCRHSPRCFTEIYSSSSSSSSSAGESHTGRRTQSFTHDLLSLTLYGPLFLTETLQTICKQNHSCPQTDDRRTDRRTSTEDSLYTRQRK